MKYLLEEEKEKEPSGEPSAPRGQELPQPASEHPIDVIIKDLARRYDS
jgi:hypothetical protein